jgi:hypothetical protein
MNFYAEIDAACARLSDRDSSREKFVEDCVRIAALAVGSTRAGLWVFAQEGGERRMRCLGMYDQRTARMVDVADRSEEGAHAYFAELERVGHVVARDARSHPATQSFFAGRLGDRGVRSLMAASFSLNGRLFGAFTCTQVDETMNWSIRQLSILTRIGSRATLALASSSPNQLTSWLAPL